MGWHLLLLVLMDVYLRFPHVVPEGPCDVLVTSRNIHTLSYTRWKRTELEKNEGRNIMRERNSQKGKETRRQKI